MAKYTIGGKEVTEEEFNKSIKDQYTFQDVNKFESIEITEPFFLDEVLFCKTFSAPKINKTEEELLQMLIPKIDNEWKLTSINVPSRTQNQKDRIETLRDACLNTSNYSGLEDITKIFISDSEEELESILKKNMNIGAPYWSQNDTGGTVFERVQESSMYKEPAIQSMKNLAKSHPLSDLAEKIKKEQEVKVYNFLDMKQRDYPVDFATAITTDWQEKEQNKSNDIAGHSTRHKAVEKHPESLGGQIRKGKIITYGDEKVGIKETENKVDYEELDFDYIDSVALRMSKNLDKYPPKNWCKEMDIKELAKSAMRHARKILQPKEGDIETLEDHAIALGANGMMINYQLKNKK